MLSAQLHQAQCMTGSTQAGLLPGQLTLDLLMRRVFQPCCWGT